ncbi:MAG: hypothetical protein GX335_08580 [Firmicutes bacterium]|nr:hypothetical protein [Bacillota bacterium]
MRCMICQKKVEDGALSFWGQSICWNCEKALMGPILEESNYQRVLNAFRSLWQEQFFLKQNRHLNPGE